MKLTVSIVVLTILAASIAARRARPERAATEALATIARHVQVDVDDNATIVRIETPAIARGLVP